MPEHWRTALSAADTVADLPDAFAFLNCLIPAPCALDRNGFFRYIRKDNEVAKYKIRGESFIVPRSYMGFRDENDEYRISFGTGEYKLSIELKETCDATDQYRKNWKEDRKRRKKLEPSEDIMTRSWQVVSSQQWNELTKQWVITTLKAPADIITQDVIDKLGLEAETSY